MTLKQYLIVMSAGTALCASAVALITFTVDADKAQTPTFIAFYASLLLTLTGCLSLAGLALRFRLSGNQAVVASMAMTSFRQAIILSIAIIATLILNRHGLVNWVSLILLTAVALATELFFASLRPKPA